MNTYVATIGGKAVLAFRAEDDDEARAMIDDQEGSMRSDLKVLLGIDGTPLWDGKSAIEVREATAAQHAEWKQSRDQAISDGEIDLDAGNNPEEWNVYLMRISLTKKVRRNYRSGRSQSEKANKQPSTVAGPIMYRFLEATAAQYMTPAVTTVTRQTTMRALGALFEKHDFNSFPVVEEGRMLGIVTKFDFLRAFAFTTGQMVPHYDELMRRPVAEMMTEAVVHVEPAAPLTRVLQLMVSLKSRSFPVIDPDRQLVGIISREDVIRSLKETTQND